MGRRHPSTPHGWCLCGCGGRTRQLTVNRLQDGQIAGEYQAYLPYHHHKAKGPHYLIDEQTGCWVWQRYVNEKGYGKIQADGRSRIAHRYFYELHKGPIPAGMHLDHLCRNPSCVNPEHLEPVTPQENTARGIEHNGAKTHCPQGHPYDEQNTKLVRRSDGGTARRCAICRKAQLDRHTELRRQGLCGHPGCLAAKAG